MDKIDEQILEILEENGREKASAISQKINLSVSAVIERIRKMTQEGIIEGYTVRVDRSKMGQDMTALMEVRLEHPKYYEGFSEAVKNIPNIVSCFYTTGDFDFMLVMYVDNTGHLEEIHRKIKNVEGVGSTRTEIVLKKVKDNLV